MATDQHWENLPEDLVEIAHELGNLRKRAYAPFSNFAVACALWYPDRPTVYGVNYECSSFGLTLCAERAAIAAAQVAGIEIAPSAIVLSSDSPEPVTPCGACRQWITELALRHNVNFPVICLSGDGKTHLQLSSCQLLPSAFEPSHLR